MWEITRSFRFDLHELLRFSCMNTLSLDNLQTARLSVTLLVRAAIVAFRQKVSDLYSFASWRLDVGQTS